MKRKKKKSLIWLFSIVLALILCVMFARFKKTRYYGLRPYFGNLIQYSAIEHPTSTKKDDKTGGIAIFIHQTDSSEAFWIDQIPVTIKMYMACVSEGICYPPHYQNEDVKFLNNKFYWNRPVTYISWHEAETYCESVGGTLPTAFQWEIAAGVSFEERIYPWWNQEPVAMKANIKNIFGDITPAGWLPYGASPYGVLDMGGNVREWVLDVFRDDEMPSSYMVDMRSPDIILEEAFADSVTPRILKGGCFFDNSDKAEIKNVLWHDPISAGYNRGFRCVYAEK